MTLLLSVILGIVCSLAAAELLDICPALTEWLISRAVGHLPKKHRERYQLEWAGDIDYMKSRRGKLTILFWAATVYVSSGRLAAQVDAATGTPEPANLFLTYLGTGSSLDEKYPFGLDLDIPTVIRNLSDDTEAEEATPRKIERKKRKARKSARRRKERFGRARGDAQLELPTVLRVKTTPPRNENRRPNVNATRDVIATAGHPKGPVVDSTPIWSDKFGDEFDIPTIIRELAD